MNNRDDHELSFVAIQEAILQKEEDLKTWCPASGENIGRVIEIRGSDEWNVECPTCGMKWAGGSTVLDDHERPHGRSHEIDPSRLA